MSKTLAVALCALALAGGVSAQATAPPTQEQPTAEQQVRAVEQEWVNAEIHKDAAALGRILDEKFVFTFGAGQPLDRDAFIRAIVSDTATDVTQTLSDATVVVDRDTAVVVGTDTVRGVSKGTPYSHAYRYTATYIRRDGRWVALAEHLVRVPEAK